MIIIPIGVDCGAAVFLRKYNLRNLAFPFDWVISYNGVSKCIEDEFKHFTDPLINTINIYDICFHHDFKNDLFVEEERAKYNKRCKRLIDILESSSEEIIFFRKGHSPHHHHEHNDKYIDIANDIEDAEKLDIIISNKYPNLNYKIIIFLVCGNCFDSNHIYTSTSDKIEIYNISTACVDDKLFETTACAVFNV